MAKFDLFDILKLLLPSLYYQGVEIYFFKDKYRLWMSSILAENFFGKASVASIGYPRYFLASSAA